MFLKRCATSRAVCITEAKNLFLEGLVKSTPQFHARTYVTKVLDIMVVINSTLLAAFHSSDLKAFSAAIVMTERHG